MDEWLRERLRTHARLSEVDNAYCLTLRDAKAAGVAMPTEQEFVEAWRAARGLTPHDRALLQALRIQAED
jgi:hypothetical protein